MKKKLTTFIFVFSLLTTLLTIFAETYKYHPIISSLLPFSLSQFITLNLTTLFFISWIKKIDNQNQYAQIVFFILGITSLLISILTNLNQQMLFISFNNTEIFYLNYHLDIRPLIQLQSIINSAFKLSFFFFTYPILRTTITLSLSLLKTIQYIKNNLSKNKLISLTQFWQESLFISSLLLFIAKQPLISIKTNNLLFLSFLAYSLTGLITHKPRLNLINTATLIVLLSTNYLDLIPKFNSKTIILLFTSTSVIFLLYIYNYFISLVKKNLNPINTKKSI